MKRYSMTKKFLSKKTEMVERYNGTWVKYWYVWKTVEAAKRIKETHDAEIKSLMNTIRLLTESLSAMGGRRHDA